MFVNEMFLLLYMTVNWHREFAVNFATFLKICRDFFTFAPWFSYSPSNDYQITVNDTNDQPLMVSNRVVT